MRQLTVAAAIALCACGGPRTGERMIPHDESPPARLINVEWKVEQGEGNLVNVELVVDGRSVALGALEAATEFEAGTPATCALRAASPRRTELVCGDANAFAADFVGGELVVTHIAGGGRTEVKRIPVEGDALAVKTFALPTGP